MNYYNPTQLMWLQAYRNDPQMLGMLRSQFSQVKPVDDTTLDTEAKAKQSEFLSGQVAPELARVVAQDANGSTGSFGAARQAALIAEGQRRAQDVYSAARSAALEREMAAQRLAMEQENRAFDQLGLNPQGAAEEQMMRAQQSRDNLDRFVEGGAAALNGLGQMMARANYMPAQRFSNAIGAGLRFFGL